MHTEQATLAHLEAVSILFDGYRQFYKQNPDLEGARRFMRERLRAGDSHIVCAVDEGEVAGFAQLYPMLDSIAMAPGWILHDLFVSPAFRRRGVARTLVRASRELGECSGASLLMLSTGIDNHAAQALYESEGWVRDDEYYYYELFLPRG